MTKSPRAAALQIAEPKIYEDHWKRDGAAHGKAPKWAKYHTDMASEFPSPFRGKRDPLAHQIEKFVERLDMLRPEPGGPAYRGKSGALTYTYPEVKDIAINQKMGDLDAVLDDVIALFEGAPNWGNPLTMCNVIPQSNTAAIIASMLSQVFSANILEGEYAWNVYRAELETAGMLGNLMGWKPKEAGALYTWGGGGCWTYGVKYGLTHVIPNSRTSGVRTDAKVICSQQAHFVQKNATDWMGPGSDNIVHVRTNVDTNQMDLGHLEEILKDFTAKKMPVATIVCTMGTTDASAFGPIREVRALIDRYPNPAGFGKTRGRAEQPVCPGARRVRRAWQVRQPPSAHRKLGDVHQPPPHRILGHGCDRHGRRSAPAREAAQNLTRLAAISAAAVPGLLT
jgi:L-2,4-diaminobutyrate decarboxylase